MTVCAHTDRAVYELILRGYVFRKGQMKIAVFKLYQVCVYLLLLLADTKHSSGNHPLNSLNNS